MRYARSILLGLAIGTAFFFATTVACHNDSNTVTGPPVDNTPVPTVAAQPTHTNTPPVTATVTAVPPAATPTCGPGTTTGVGGPGGVPYCTDCYGNQVTCPVIPQPTPTCSVPPYGVSGSPTRCYDCYGNEVLCGAPPAATPTPDPCPPIIPSCIGR